MKKLEIGFIFLMCSVCGGCADNGRTPDNEPPPDSGGLRKIGSAWQAKTPPAPAGQAPGAATPRSGAPAPGKPLYAEPESREPNPANPPDTQPRVSPPTAGPGPENAKAGPDGLPTEDAPPEGFDADRAEAARQRAEARRILLTIISRPLKQNAPHDRERELGRTLRLTDQAIARLKLFLNEAEGKQAKDSKTLPPKAPGGDADARGPESADPPAPRGKPSEPADPGVEQ